MSMVRRTESFLDPMIVGVAIAPKLHVRILTAWCFLLYTGIVLYLVVGSYSNNSIPQGYRLNGLFWREGQFGSLYHYFHGEVHYEFQ